MWNVNYFCLLTIYLLNYLLLFCFAGNSRNFRSTTRITKYPSINSSYCSSVHFPCYRRWWWKYRQASARSNYFLTKCDSTIFSALSIESWCQSFPIKHYISSYDGDYPTFLSFCIAYYTADFAWNCFPTRKFSLSLAYSKHDWSCITSLCYSRWPRRRRNIWI